MSAFMKELAAYERHVAERDALRSAVLAVLGWPDPRTIRKLADDLGLVFGWAIVCTQLGEPAVNVHDEHVPDDVMLEGAAEFMANNRALKVQHKGRAAGTVVFAWPLTAEVAKHMGITSAQTGLMVAVKPSSPDVFAQFKDGELPAFEIGAEVELEEDEGS